MATTHHMARARKPSHRRTRRIAGYALLFLGLLSGLTVPVEAQPARPKAPARKHQAPTKATPSVTTSSAAASSIKTPSAPAVSNPKSSDSEDEARPPLRPIEAGPFGDRLDLHGVWLMHLGSGPAFADPAFDDSAWLQIDTRSSLVRQRIWNPNEVWYRLHLHLVPGSRNLALALAKIGGSYRVYVNGQELGGHGSMQGQGDYLVARWDTYPVPDELIRPGDLVVAVHAFVGTVNRTSFTILDGISPSSSIYLGPASVLARDQTASHQKEQNGALIALWCMLLVLSLSLSLLVRGAPIYALLATYAGAHILNSLLAEYAASHYLSNTQWITLPTNLMLAVGAIAGLEFCRLIAGSARRLWFTLFEVFYLFSVLLLYLAASGMVSFVVYSVTDEIARGCIYVAVGMFLLFGMARRRRNAFILGGIALLYLVYLGLWNVLSFIPLSPGPYATLAARFVATLQPARTAEFALIVALFTLLVAQTLDIVRERGAISSEIEAARTMQQLLLTRSSEATPGFTVETAYLPAGEVGGDFFLVSPTRDGSLAAVVGDVSGKGLRAAMQVSMILGVLRREPSRDPATVLCSLNEALLSQQDTGFTTACAVELCADGRYTIANAGHISPYLTGMGRSLELIAPPAFPLGLAGDQSYDVLCGQLKPGQRLVLMSDGIVEARASHGELYGFERLLPLTLRPAAEIASTALAFGQDDDITVVTLSCQFSEAKPAQPAEARTAIQPQPQSQSQPAPKPAPPPSPIHRPTPPPPIP